MKLLLAVCLFALHAQGTGSPNTDAVDDNARYANAMREALKAFEAIEITGRVHNIDLSDGGGGSIVGGTDAIKFRSKMAPKQFRCDA